MTVNQNGSEKKRKKGNSGRTGKVWLAGAGPGDAGLLTVKAAELIERADVIVYDALISAELLSRIPRDTETIYVGKHAGKHPVPQEEINQILVREAEKREKRTSPERRRSLCLRPRGRGTGDACTVGHSL